MHWPGVCSTLAIQHKQISEVEVRANSTWNSHHNPNTHFHFHLTFLCIFILSIDCSFQSKGQLQFNGFEENKIGPRLSICSAHHNTGSYGDPCDSFYSDLSEFQMFYSKIVIFGLQNEYTLTPVTSVQSKSEVTPFVSPLSGPIPGGGNCGLCPLIHH